MLPQVATHILHHTSRAAAAVHNQTSQAFRNAWQFQQAPSTSSVGGGSITGWSGVGSSSGWGGSSTGPGGAKYNAGSRFYGGYTGPGRSFTHANQTSIQLDGDNDEHTAQPVRIQPGPTVTRTRPRSTSLSLSAQGRKDRGEGLGVLKVVQMRARHAFATNLSMTDAAVTEFPQSTPFHEFPVLTRRNSTSTHSVSSSKIDLDLPQLALPASSDFDAGPERSTSDIGFVSDLSSSTSRRGAKNKYDDSDTSASDFEEQKPQNKADLESYNRLYLAANTRDYNEVVSEVQRFRAESTASVACYNMAMQALSGCRSIGQPITFIMELYNEMLARSLLPNLRTYKILITACCVRDIECQRVLATLENRISRRSFTVGSEVVNGADEQRVSRLRAENNFATALTLFQAATSASNTYLGISIYNALLRSCAYHGNVEAALRIFSHMERFDKKPAPSTFAHLMGVYCNTCDLEGARAVFKEFKEASRQGRINWEWLDRVTDSERARGLQEHHTPSGRLKLARTSQVSVWNKMIEAYFKRKEPAAALGLLETMLDTPPGELFGEADAPLPNSVTYTTIITGFCDMGDWKSALTWFDRLLAQQSIAKSPFEPLTSPPRPDQTAWIVMLDSLARAGAIDELNRLFITLVEVEDQDAIHVRTVDRHSVFRANVLAMQAPGIEPARSQALFEFLLKKVVVFDSPKGTMALTTSAARSMLLETVELLMARNQAETALDITERYVANERSIVQEAENTQIVTPEQVVYHSKGLRSMVKRACRIMFFEDRRHDPSSPFPSVKFAMRIAALSERVYVKPQVPVAPWYIHSYTETKKRGEPFELSENEWILLLNAFLAIETPPMDTDTAEAVTDTILPPPGYEYPGLYSLLVDLKDAPNVNVWKVVTMIRNKIVKALIKTHGAEEASRMIAELGPKFSNLALPGWGASTRGPGIAPGLSIPDLKTSAPPNIHVDMFHSRFVDEWYPSNPSVTPLNAFDRFVSGAERNIYPTPETMGRLISGLGRLGEVDKVRKIYDAAQITLAALEEQKRWQSAGWFIVEDQMIIAFAHAGHVEAANVHRSRIIEQGGTPSADAYGALISAVKDTTDDTTNALALWDEAITREVRANTYLYNTIISKLSKARKADQALVVFRKMQTQGIKPSSITFGALISACCRVGDEQSAEHLFHEMTSAFNFKPRVPPYNTMIQFYTHTKQNRERVLYYYNALLAARIKPTAHTYKLLLEAYGTIQPVDLASMEDIFRRITESRDVEVNGAHWAALINAYGCAAKDLDLAINTFESISVHPSTTRSSAHLPDAITYEALFAVFSHHRRADLIQKYLQRLRESNIHPTAYVANAAIKGYAAAGDLENARKIFEDLEDPPMGIAAPHNHAPHEQQNPVLDVPPEAPVYREPSTWEAMIRAELGVSERERAMELIQRMEARQYPTAVVQRIRDIMYSNGFYESITPPSSVSTTSPA